MRVGSRLEGSEYPRAVLTRAKWPRAVVRYYNCYYWLILGGLDTAPGPSNRHTFFSAPRVVVTFGGALFSVARVSYDRICFWGCKKIRPAGHERAAGRIKGLLCGWRPRGISLRSYLLCLGLPFPDAILYVYFPLIPCTGRKIDAQPPPYIGGVRGPDTRTPVSNKSHNPCILHNLRILDATAGPW